MKRLMLQLAKFEFNVKPAAAIASIHSGIPSKHLPVWEGLSVADFYSTYTALSVSPAKVLKMMENCVISNPSEERVLSYLRQYIGNIALMSYEHFFGSLLAVVYALPRAFL